MKAITFVVRLLEPLLVSQAEAGEENSAVGLSFIPGSALRGALVARYLRAHPSADLAAEPIARQLFFDGPVCFLNAYPHCQGRRTLPRPLSWFTEKSTASDDRAVLHDWAVDPDQALTQPKAPTHAEFCLATDDGQVACYESPRQVNVHISLENANRRGPENKVYRYDAVAPGEVLSGAIVADDGTDLAPVRELLEPGEISLGGAHLAGYGRALIAEVTERPAWQECAPGNTSTDGRLIVTLLSDAILRNEDGQVDGGVDGALAAVMGITELKAMAAYRRVRVVAGFNRKWSLPLPQAWVVQAGSVFVYRAGAFDADQMRRQVALGIGERRAEGFGRVAVNWHTQPVLQRVPVKPEPLSDVELSPASRALAKQMAQRRLQLLLERRLAEAVTRLKLSALPQNAQLSRVRTAAQQSLASHRLTPIVEHLARLKGAREQFVQARVDGGTGSRTLLDWINERAAGQDVEVQILEGSGLPQIAGETAVLTAELRADYTARLIDGVMKKAAKQNQQEAKR